MRLESTLTLVAMLVARAAVMGAGIGDAIAIASLAALHGFRLYLNHHASEKVDESVRKDVSELKDAVSALKIKSSFGR